MKKLISLLLVIIIVCTVLVGCEIGKFWVTTTTVPNEVVLDPCSIGNHSTDLWVEEGEYVSIYCTECEELVHKGKPNYDLIFRLNSEETAYSVISALKEAENEVIIIPPSYNGLPVTEVRSLEPESSFDWYTSTITYKESHIKTVYIPPSVKSLGDFILCDKLETIYISSGVVEMEKWALRHNDSLKNIFVSASNPNYKSENGVLYTKDGSTLIKYTPNSSNTSFEVPEGVTAICEEAFGKAKNLKFVLFPNTLEIIEISAFMDCSALESIVIPENVVKIGWGAFRNCTSLKDVSIGSGVKELGRLAFNGCKSLEAIDVDSENLCFSDYDNNLYDKDRSILLQYALGSKEESFSVLGGTETIGEFAFAGAQHLKEVILPETVTRIKNNAFDDCMALEIIHLPKSLKNIEEHAFGWQMKIKEVHIKSLSSWFDVKLEGLYSSPFCDSADLYVNGELLEHLEIPSYVSEIPQHAFMGCQSIKTITITGATKTVGECAFFNCKSLEVVNLKDSVRRIEGSAFYGCTSLKELTIPDSVTYIDNCAFSDCTSLESIVLPNQLRSINSSMFSGCTALKSITIPTSVKEIGFNSFLYCESLEEIIYAGTVENWIAIEKSSYYNNNCKVFTVRCTNGVITVDEWQ